jgi:peptidoglycan/xylan/chitin deacetylase (PgdA/CDA1 family)
MGRESPLIPILMYHRIERPNRSSKVSGHYVSPRLFEKHMWALSKLGYRTIPLTDLADESAVLPRKPVVITFDDGYANFHTNALPALQRHGFSATVFLVADRIGDFNAWDLQNGDVREPLLSASQVLECQAKGIDFGSHTLNHADLSQCSQEEAWRQISDSRKAVEAITGRPVTTFCYPYGRYTSENRRMVGEAGYSVACSTHKGVNKVGMELFELKRINIRRDTSLPILAYKLWRGARIGR